MLLIVNVMVSLMPKFLTLISPVLFTLTAGNIPEQNRDVPSEDPCLLVINEMMIDPTPLVGLPDFEWIELLNFSNCTVNLAGWKLEVGTSQRILPEAVLLPGELVVLCSSAAAPQLAKWGRIVALGSFPALRNSGNRVTLYSPSGTAADVVSYSDAWYKESKKREGGWSLERIDPARSCGQSANWSASVDPKGGTPGAVNSVFAANIDHTKPEIIWGGALSVSTAGVDFSEPMDTLRLQNRFNYRLSDGWDVPATVEVTGENKVILSWNRPFEINKSYTLVIENQTDACGNQLGTVPVTVQWITLAPGDVVINEVLFNPWPGGADFVEIYNRSDKRIDSRLLVLASRDAEMKLKQPVSLSPAQAIVLPGSYLAVTIDTSAVFSFYTTFCRSGIRQLPALPSYPNERGQVVLLTDSLKVLDEFSYSEKMHHPLLYDVKGVSLERINPDTPAGQPGNWQSAASVAGYATPGCLNSQFSNEPVRATRVMVEPAVISPDSDGYNDELNIRYETKTSGWVANAWIFDASGRTVCRLLKNELMQTSGLISWKGEDETGKRLDAGIYVLLIELFDMNGNIERHKKAVTLTVRYE